MSILTRALALSSVLMCTFAPAWADPQPASQPPAPETRAAAVPPASGTSAVVMDLAAIDGVIGKSVKSYAGEDLGRIVDVLVTPTGRVGAAVIDFGGLLGVGSRKIAVDWKALEFSKSAKGGAVILDLTRNEVRVSPEYKSGDPVVVLEAMKPTKSEAPSTTSAPPTGK